MYYQDVLSLLLIVVGMAFAAPSPHVGMINNDDVRDVGAVYSQADFSSAPTFLLMDKQSPRCIPRYVISPLLLSKSLMCRGDNDDIVSIMICVESVECSFWKVCLRRMLGVRRTN